MPRIPRGQQTGFVYHVINRGNGRVTIFHKAQDHFGLRLFQTFQEPALSSIEGPALSLSKGSTAFLRLASFAQDRRSVQDVLGQRPFQEFRSSSCSNGPSPQTKDHGI